jgi:superfamily II DNA or RNA helicase
VIGVTATPDRADEAALGQVFASVSFDYEVLDAIHDGYLVPVRQTVVEVQDLDFSQVRTTAGDLNGKDLAAIMEDEKALHEIASPTLDIVGARKTLVFATSVKHAERLCEIFNRHEASASWLCGKTPKEQRREILERFAKGELRILCNVGVLTEGFDDPGVEVVVIARPTKSRALYAQMVGRGTRPLPGVIDGILTKEDRIAAILSSGKPSVEILDFAGNSGRHKLVTTADILGGKMSDEVVERALRKVAASTKPGGADMAEALAQAELELHDERKKAEARERAKLQAKAKYQTKQVNPFDVLNIEPGRERGWEQGKQLTEKQANLLRGQGINPEDRSYHENKRLLDELFRRWDSNMCSFKQARILQKYGYPTDCDRDTAKAVIDGLAANGWKRVS